MEILGSFLIGALVFTAYYLGLKQNNTNHYTIQVPEIKVVMPTQEKEIQVSSNKAEQVLQEYEEHLEQIRKEQERLPDERKILNDVNETVNSIYDAFLNGTPIEEGRNES